MELNLNLSSWRLIEYNSDKEQLSLLEIDKNEDWNEELNVSTYNTDDVSDLTDLIYDLTYEMYDKYWENYYVIKWCWHKLECEWYWDKKNKRWVLLNIWRLLYEYWNWEYDENETISYIKKELSSD